MTDPFNPYLPEVATILETVQETHNIKTFRVRFDDEAKMAAFTFGPGQVGQLSAPGIGESTFVINSPPTRMDYLQFSVMRAGEVTAKLHNLVAGDKVGVRAPLGKPFPVEDMKGKDIVFVGGGIGMAPLRTLFLYMLDNRADFGKIRLLYGARSPLDMAFSAELPEWTSRADIETTLTIDREAEGWEHKVGLIPNVLLEMAPKPENCVAITCGPPIMIKFTLEALKKLEFPDEQILTTLEKRMKCGIGICGRCNIGSSYVCVDGPVYTYAQLKALPNEL
ncbi:MAG: FAD/NAD(P)-binding protein [Acidobacteriota bacterium]